MEKEQQQLIKDMLSYNPRPAYQTDDPNRLFGTCVFDLDMKWRHTDNTVTVESIH